jgi:hypothetical protein
MTTMLRISSAAALIGAAIACGRSSQVADTAAPAKSRAMTQAGDVFIARREAQLSFDSARARLGAKNYAAAARSLREAAAFTRQHADSIAEPAKKALKTSTDELNRLATRLAGGRAISVRTLDNAFARAQLAEVQYHCVRALDAWKLSNGPETGAELMMLIDHFERAAVDGRQTLTAAAKEMIAGTRATGVKLIQGTAVEPSAVDSILAATDKEVHTLMAALR